MQIKGKIFTIAGIVLLFGYFIMESFKNPSVADPNQVIMVGKDTLGRNWDAMATQKEQAAAQATITHTEDKNTAPQTGNGSLLPENEDPYLKDKFNSSNYSSIESPDGREIITGYNNPYEEEEIDNGDNYQTRHQKEKGEPVIKYSVE